MKNLKTSNYTISVLALLGFGVFLTSANAEVIPEDLIVQGSECIGFDCVSGESFGFDTLRLKENNLRIKADDTSATSSFAQNDWQLTFNETANGGLNKFSIDDITGGKTPFTIEAGAPSNSLYVDDGGKLGVGTSAPAVEVHVVDGDSPTLRLEQDGSSGFGAQVWDMASNETNFFIRDTTNGSTLPFRIRPGAPTSSIDISADGDVGIGTASPLDDLHISDAGPARLRLTNTSITPDAVKANHWSFNSNGTLRISADADAPEFILDNSGNLKILGALTTAGGVTPDYVFQPEYKLMSLDDVEAHIKEKRHLPNIPSAADIKKKGSLNMSLMQMKLLEKVEELTLYTLAQERIIRRLDKRMKELEE